MNKKYAKEFLPFIQAWADGKDITYSGAVMGSMDFNGDVEDYKIVEKPIEIWCMVNSNNHVIAKSLKTRESCQKWIDGLFVNSNDNFDDYKPFMFRQVTDEPL